jgi:hypothetical protein
LALEGYPVRVDRLGEMIILNICGSVASVLGFVLSLYILWRENRIEDEVLDLTRKEAKRHDLQ